MTGLAARLRRLAERTPLRVKLVVTLIALVTAALALAGIAATTELRSYQLRQVDDELVHNVARIGPADRGELDEPPTGRRTCLPGDSYLQITDTAGRVRSTSHNPLCGDRRPKVPALDLAGVERRAGQPFTVPAEEGDGSWRVIVRPLRNGGGGIAFATDLRRVDRTVAELAQLEVVTGLIVLLLGGGLGYVLVRRNLRPLEEVEATAAAIAGGDLSRRVPDRDPRTEVGRLGRALNGMLAQIEAAFRVREASESAARRSEEKMRRFVADASHELRTPLASIRGFAELYRQGAAASPTDLARVMRRIEDEAGRMGLLVDDLLLLARLDQQRPLVRAPVDLLTLAADAVHDARAVDPDRPIDLEVLDGPAPPVVTGDEPRLRQVIGNLVTNALAHTPAGTPVTVRLGTLGPDGSGTALPAVNGTATAGGVAVLEVADAGPGLAADDAERIFERFYRPDPARKAVDGARTRSSGAGLGLSIVHALTVAHGGSVELDTRPGDGATFRVILPLA